MSRPWLLVEKGPNPLGHLGVCSLGRLLAVYTNTKPFDATRGTMPSAAVGID